MTETNRNRIFWTLVLCVLMAGWGLAGTHSPWDGTLWDVAAPDIDQPIGNHYKELYDLRKGIAIRMNKEHETLATASAGGVHKQGSARAFFQDAEPTTQVDGSAFDSGDLGSLWFDSNASPDNRFHVLTATTPTWTPISTEVIAVLLASNRTFAGTLDVTGAFAINTDKFTVSATGVTAIANDLTINTNKFTVSASSGNTAVAGALDVTGDFDPTTFTTTNGGFKDEDAMTSNSATAAASQQSIKYYIDNRASKGTDGSISTGYRYCNVAGSDTKVFTKYLSGNLDADASTDVAHGVAGGASDIWHCSAAVFEDSGNVWRVADTKIEAGSEDANLAFILLYDGTNVQFRGVGANCQGNLYHIKIDYTL